MIEISDVEFGEIDIVAKDKNELVFIEVKTRSQNNFGRPSDAIDKRKKKHIYRTAEYYMLINKLQNLFCRLDVVEVYILKNETKINYFKNCILEKPNTNLFKEREDDFYN